MGLLRSLGSRQGKISGTWKAASISSNNELKHESLSSQGGMVSTVWLNTKSFDSFTRDDAPPSSLDAREEYDDQRGYIKYLERQLQERDAIISTMLEVEDERKSCLEHQIELLIELSSKQRADTSESLPRKKHSARSVIEDISSFPSEEIRRDKELAALHELLARIIAEKDRLKHETESLKQLIKMQNRPKRAPRLTRSLGDCPLSIDELYDNLKEISRNMKSARDDAPDKPKTPSTETRDTPSQKGSTKAKANLSRDKISNRNKVTYLYQMSCRECDCSHCHIPYSSVFVTANDAQKEMPKILKKHYKRVWQIVQHLKEDDATDSISPSVHKSRLKKDQASNSGFPSSSFGRHLVKHCSSCNSESDVLQWCIKNVKIEMQKNAW